MKNILIHSKSYLRNSFTGSNQEVVKKMLFLSLILIGCLTPQFLFAQPDAPVGFVANPASGPGEVFLACGPNDVGMNDIVYKLYYAETATTPADPLTATEYTFGTTGGDGGGTSAFGFTISGLLLSTEYTFWLYQYNTVTMEHSLTPDTKTQTSGGNGPPSTPVGFVANTTTGSGQVFLACGPNDVGMNDIVYKLYYSETATAPVDPLTATEYIFSSTAGDGNGIAAFGFTLSGLSPGTDHTFWLYQYNTSTMEYSLTPNTKTQVSSGTALPVTWQNPLKAIMNKNSSVELIWSVSQQVNNDKFVIEHSKNGVNFSTIGSIEGGGTTMRYQEYSYTHSTPTEGSNYYRIQQIDYDGKFDYSNVTNIFHIKEAEISVFPNPATTHITVQLKESMQIEIFGTHGRFVQSQKLNEGNNLVTIENLSVGMYFMKTENGTVMRFNKN